ncbi:hypothetical protein L1887_52983 [Cichorium endivia]|nr:hypothetical protein L1887_52983 [Cichorium endivia]
MLDFWHCAASVQLATAIISTADECSSGAVQPKLVIQRDLSHGRFDQIRPRAQFPSRLKTIVDDHGQVIGEKAVTAVDNKILTCQTLIGMNLTGEEIVKVRHRGALLYTYGGIFRGKIKRAAVAVIDATHALDTRAGAGAVIGKSPIAKPGQTFPIGIVTF